MLSVRDLRIVAAHYSTRNSRIFALRLQCDQPQPYTQIEVD